MEIYRNKLLRKIILPIFSKINPGNIYITHHYTGDRILLHSFRHKGYWFHKRERERNTMSLFKKLINKGDTVIEIGGHIGYISLYFSNLIGKEGMVYVFEPGINNLPYLKNNIKDKCNIVVIEKGVGNCDACIPFYIENLTGQNNSFIKDFQGFIDNKKNSFVKNASVKEVTVDVVRLDNFIINNKISPNFIKIDVEGYEFEVIKGMSYILKNIQPIFMIEIQDNYKSIYNVMKNENYLMFNDNLKLIKNFDELSGNTFFMHSIKHISILNTLGVDIS
jgi:FkbM family methyltransferase